MDDFEGAVEQVGVLRPGDRLIVRISPSTTPSQVDRLRDRIEQMRESGELSDVPVVFFAVDDLIIDRSGGEGG